MMIFAPSGSAVIASGNRNSPRLGPLDGVRLRPSFAECTGWLACARALHGGIGYPWGPGLHCGPQPVRRCRLLRDRLQRAGAETLSSARAEPRPRLTDGILGAPRREAWCSI